jgi:hypothetical protein
MALQDKAWYVKNATGISITDLGTANNAAGATITLTAVTVPAGATIVVVTTEAATTVGTLSDGGTNTYTNTQSQVINAVSIGVVWRKENASALSNATFTYTKHTSGSKACISAFFITGVPTSSVLDLNTTPTTGSSTSPSITSAAPANANELFVGIVCWEGTATTFTAPASTNWTTGPLTSSLTQTTAQQAGCTLYNISASTVTFAPTLGATQQWAAFLLSFKGTTSPAGWSGITAWAASTSKVCGNLVRQLALPTVGNERVFVCIASTSGTGQTNSSEPAWTVTRGAKNTDNTVTWQEATGIAALNGDLTNTVTWAAVKNTVVTLGQVIQNVAGTLLLICTTSGTAGNGSEPSWASFTSAGATTSDNTVTWTTLGPPSNYSIWNAPHARVANAMAANWGQSGNSIFVSANHSEVQQSALNLTGGTFYCYSVKDSPGATPPGSSDLQTGATLTTTGAFSLSLGIAAVSGLLAYLYGFTFNAGTGNNANVLGSGANLQPQYVILDSCTGNSNSTGAAGFNFGGSAQSSIFVAKNCTFTFNSLTANFLVSCQTGKFIGCTFAATGVVPTTFNTTSASIATAGALFEACDLSAFGSGKTLAASAATGMSRHIFVDCKLGASVTLASTPGQNGTEVGFIRCDSGSTNYQHAKYAYGGTLTATPTNYRTGGASDGTTSIGWNIATTANPNWIYPFESFVIPIWNATTGTNRGVTVYGIINAAAVPNNDDIWIEAEYLGASGSPLGSIATETKANNLATGSALTADSTSSWNATARVNSHTYNVGDIISVSSNTSRIFFCTVGGAASSGLPAAYASAVDGGTVTDNAATFRAGCRFSMALTLSAPQPQLAGPINVTVKAAKVSTTFFVDPLVNLS